MPFYKYKTSINLPKKAKAFFGVEGGITRGLLPLRFSRPTGPGVRPENMVWVFGAGRTGSTWIAAMMKDVEGHEVWFERRVGACFDPDNFGRGDGRHFFFSTEYKDLWLDSVRRMILEGANARFPEIGAGHLFIKEPGGSQGAPIIMDALPESRIVLLVRDPRDVAASWLDAARKGGWQSKELGLEETSADVNPELFVHNHAVSFMKNVGNAKRAFDAHDGYKTLVRYEDLRSDTLGVMRRMYHELGVPVGESELSKVVERHSWKNIPEKEKGEGKFYRKAKPEGWKEDLTPHQARIVEKVTASLLEEFGYS